MSLPGWFDTKTSCMNMTSNCHGHGSCVNNGTVWLCNCNFMYLPSDFCYSFFTVFFSKFNFIWIVLLSLYALLALLVLLEISLNLKSNKFKNAMMLLKTLLFLYILCRMMECLLWLLNIHRPNCPQCVNALYILILFPFSLGIIVFTICVIVWYSLILSFKMKQDLYVIGRNMYIGLGSIYSIGTIILLILISTNFEVYLQILTYWTIIPLFLLVGHSLYHVTSLHLELKHREADKSIRKAKKKNKALGTVSLIYIALLAACIIQVYYGTRTIVNYIGWLVCYCVIRVIELVIMGLFYKFSEKYTSFYCCGTPTSTMTVSKTKQSTQPGGKSTTGLTSIK
eukprot:TRINITY_DN12509_c0_g1_i1.p1 TRINITY_DN12509_c0_g1~~TRINITY_DN12509_c0_g1_i1.p1  ORF type:complete len:350 (-),score=54.62 TRINITY_DN12509_c0_g1_i1:15-1034(-)